jgi:hypothetical protein
MFRENYRAISAERNKLSVVITATLALMLPLTGNALAKRAQRTIS